MNSIQAAKFEVEGKGEFSLSGCTIKFNMNNQEYIWSCKTEKQAREHLIMFRKSIQYVK